MECKYCGSSNHRKNGYSDGYQRYNCKDCNRNWTLTKGRAYSSDIRFQALKLYEVLGTFKRKKYIRILKLNLNQPQRVKERTNKTTILGSV